MKTAKILDLDDDKFGLEYDNNLGKRNTMSLEAATYEKAIHEAKKFLGINGQNLDADGTLWEIE
jgi:hypothetical protein